MGKIEEEIEENKTKGETLKIQCTACEWKCSLNCPEWLGNSDMIEVRTH